MNMNTQNLIPTNTEVFMKKFSHFAVIVFAALMAAPALAETGAPAAGGMAPLIGLGKTLGIALAVFGGAIGQSLAAGKAVEGISRNPSAVGSIQTAMIIGLSLIESLVLFAWVLIAFLV